MTQPLVIPGLVCFWPFQAGDGDALTSIGPHRYTLEEMNGAIARGTDGVFGASCLDIQRGQWLRIRHDECPALDLHGKSEVSVVAWTQRRADNVWQYIAGMWDEGNANRQYALFTSGHKQSHSTDLSRTDAEHQAHGYVSDVGGATPGCKFCFSYATGQQRVPTGEWTMVGFSYDHRSIRVYVNGSLGANGDCNPFNWTKPIHQGANPVPDFTVAQRCIPAWSSYPHGESQREGFSGLLGGLAVYSRALTAAEFAGLYAGTLPS